MAKVSLTKSAALRLIGTPGKKDYKSESLAKAMAALNEQFSVLYVCEETPASTTLR